MKKKPLAAITVRLPQSDYDRLRDAARERGVSLNSLAAEALAQYGLVAQREQVLEQMKALRESLPPLGEEEPDSTELLRQLRRERSERGGSGQNGRLGEGGPAQP